MEQDPVFYSQENLLNPQHDLECKLIAEYLSEKGYRLADLKNLTEQQAGKLMKEASTYATMKLAEIEARSKFRQKIHLPG